MRQLHMHSRRAVDDQYVHLYSIVGWML